MCRTLRYVIAGASIATGLIALRMSRQFDRCVASGFRLDAEDLP